jgi:hypothetical protein
VLTKSYGGKFLKSLPDMPWLGSQQEAITYMESLD